MKTLLSLLLHIPEHGPAPRQSTIQKRLNCCNSQSYSEICSVSNVCAIIIPPGSLLHQNPAKSLQIRRVSHLKNARYGSQEDLDVSQMKSGF
jgi:hypothetical protein